MPRTTPLEDLKLIEAIVAAHSSGIGIADIEVEIERRRGDKPNRRTLQRHLHKLIEARRLTTEGKASPCSTNRRWNWPWPNARTARRSWRWATAT